MSNFDEGWKWKEGEEGGESGEIKVSQLTFDRSDNHFSLVNCEAKRKVKEKMTENG